MTTSSQTAEDDLARVIAIYWRRAPVTVHSGDRILARAILSAGYGLSTKESCFRLGDRVRKRKGSSWQGRIVGSYSTSLTREGYAVESEREPGSVQIYPAAALEKIDEQG